MPSRQTLDAWDRQRGYNQWALEALGNSNEVCNDHVLHLRMHEGK